MVNNAHKKPSSKQTHHNKHVLGPTVMAWMQGEQPAAWNHLYNMRLTFEVMWCLPNPERLPILSVLARVERPDFIHVKTKPQIQQASLIAGLVQRDSSTPIAAQTLLFELPRFQMTFELHPGQPVLKCQEHKGYHLARREDTDRSTDLPEELLPLMSFHNFLLLHPNEAALPVKLLIPQGTIQKNAQSGEVSILIDKRPELHSLELYQYKLHAKTQNLDCQVIQYRLFLAAIFAATHCEVPIPQLGMTGGEHARQLLWQCRVNQPLTTGEAAALQALAQFAGHTPRLQLCSMILRASEALCFLHGREEPQADGYAAAEQQEAYRQAQWMYLQQRREAGCLPFVHVRKELGAEELQATFNRQRPHRRLGTVCVPASVGWTELHDALLADDQALAALVSSAESEPFHAKLVALKKRYCVETTVAPCATEDLSLDHLMTDPFGREVAADHVESVKVFRSCEAAETVPADCLEELAAALQKLLKHVSEAEMRLRSFLLRVMTYTAGDLHSMALLVFQQAGIMASPAPADLLRVTLRQGFLKV